LNLQRPGLIVGPVIVVVAAGRPDQRKRDLDNIATKARSWICSPRMP
jgi:hypothetical protein